MPKAALSFVSRQHDKDGCRAHTSVDVSSSSCKRRGFHYRSATIGMPIESAYEGHSVKKHFFRSPPKSSGRTGKPR
jgi:hypothetical protein